VSALVVGNAAVPVVIRRNARATRMSLRIDSRDGSVIVILPPDLTDRHALAFATSKAEWLAGRLAALPPNIPFEDGLELPVLGVVHRLRHHPTGRCGVWAEDGEITVAGRKEYFARRLTDWLRRRAREEIIARAHPMAASIGKSFGTIRLKDTRSRWGSCSRTGDLVFSWRLVLAPADVLAYVVGHEVAHLSEMNHSNAFWRLVDRLVPDGAAGRAWLKRNGALLHRYGRM
jgi:predicted metal-dependent hydrolase